METVAVERAAEHVRHALAIIEGRHELYPRLQDGTLCGCYLLHQDYLAVTARLCQALGSLAAEPQTVPSAFERPYER